MNRDKALKQAEQLLKAGKVEPALAQLQRITERAPDDLLTLNRLGDLLTRYGRHAEAINYYNQIAERFVDGGFLPKAIAMYKKIVRLDPQHVEGFVQLGELYVRQELPSEARGHLLHAADVYLQAKKFEPARDVYVRLVAMEPEDPRHRARLAESLAASGDTEGGAEELLKLGGLLVRQQKLDEAESTYRRAGELMPSRPEPWVGLAGLLAGQGRAKEAIPVLEQAASGGVSDVRIVAELIRCYGQLGRGDEALDRLAGIDLLEAPPEAVASIFRGFVEAGDAEPVWQAVTPVLETAAEQPSIGPLALLLEAVGRIEDPGHVPALQRLYELHKKVDDRPGMIGALQWLARTYQARSMHDEASLMLDKLQALAPEQEEAGSASAAAAAALAERAPVSAEDMAPDVIELSMDDIDPPAQAIALNTGSSKAAPRPGSSDQGAELPQNRADEEFVAGRLTQAEILQKYGLRDQALEQLGDITSRFPGHIEAQERMVLMLRGAGAKGRLGKALQALALAMAGAGDANGARRAADEAIDLGLASEGRSVLEQAGIIAPAPVEVPPVAPAAVAEPSPVRVEPAAPDSEVVHEIDDPGDCDEFVIDFEGGPTEAEMLPAVSSPVAPVAPVAPAAPAASGVAAGGAPLAEVGSAVAEPAAAEVSTGRLPSTEMLEEIEFYLEQEMIEDADRRIQALAKLGYGGATLEALGTKVAAELARWKEELAVATVTEPAESAEPAAIDVGDLSDIHEALESELFAEEEPSVLPPVAEDEDINEVFAAFKQHVQDEIGGEDFRTHYDLGIAYKEMGLVDEAIEQFERVVQSPELQGEACSMLALCLRERGQLDVAARWYRQAIVAVGEEPVATVGLRYELAEVLREAGDEAASLALFREVQAHDATYRDTAARVSELESRLEG